MMIDLIVESSYQFLARSLPNGTLMPFLYLAFGIVVVLIIRDITTYLKRRGNPLMLLLVIGGLFFAFYLYLRR